MATDSQLKKLTQVIEKLVNKQVAPVAPVAPIAPLAPINPFDHDLLTRLDTKVDQIQLDVTTLKNQGTIYVTQTDHKVVCEIQDDHEKRIRDNEKNITRVLTWGSALVVLIGIVEFIINGFIN